MKAQEKGPRGALGRVASMVRRRFAPGSEPDEIVHAPTADGLTLALRRYLPRATEEELMRGITPSKAFPVILCHGLGANHLSLDLDAEHGLAQRLAAEGFDCFVLGLRGTRGSAAPIGPRGQPWDFGFDEHLLLDVPAAIARVREVTGAPRVHWIGHSLGGVLGLSIAASNPFHASSSFRVSQADRLGEPRFSAYESIASVVAVATPLDFEGVSGLGRWLSAAMFLGRLLGSKRLPQATLAACEAPLMGRVHLGRAFDPLTPSGIDGAVVRTLHAHGAEDISLTLLSDLQGWVTNGRLASRDGRVDYEAAMRVLDAPVLYLSGAADTWVPATSEARARILLSRVDVLRVGEATGARTDYGHADILLGPHTHADVTPQIAQWLARVT